MWSGVIHGWLVIDPAACGHLPFGSMPYSDIELSINFRRLTFLVSFSAAVTDFLMIFQILKPDKLAQQDEAIQQNNLGLTLAQLIIRATFNFEWDM
jgi:hypothetical protein